MRMTSLQIDWYDNGLTCGELIVHQVISVYRNKRQITYRGYNAISTEPKEIFTVPMENESCEALFALLEIAESNNDFEQDFIVKVCDGWAWNMRLRHSNNSISIIEGTVEYPAHGEEIEQFIRTAFDHAHILADPMIFGCRIYDEEDECEDEE